MRKRHFVTAACLGLAMSAAAVRAQIAFSDVTNTAGLGGEVYYSFSSHSLGVAWVDVNLDGYPDIVSSNGFDFPGDDFSGTRPHLYLNSGPGGGFSFTLRDDLLPPAPPNLEYVGIRYAGVDKDGDSDLYFYTAHEQWSLNKFDSDPHSGNPNDGPPNFLLRNMAVESGGTVSDPPAIESLTVHWPSPGGDTVTVLTGAERLRSAPGSGALSTQGGLSRGLILLDLDVVFLDDPSKALARRCPVDDVHLERQVGLREVIGQGSADRQ